MDNDRDGHIDETGEYDPNMGYSYSQAYVVNSNVGQAGYRPVVIFGNGYNSDNRKAVLYVLAADSGEILRIIDTGADGENGLSTPALIDTNLDRQVDYAYAGDLKGNLWKFDLTADTPEKWGVAYGTDMDGDGVIDAADGDLPAPLFQAPDQPITGRPEVMAMTGSRNPQTPGYLVFWGTGRYLGATDLTDRSRQSIYAVWDYGDDNDDSEYLGALVDRGQGTLSSGLMLFKKSIVGETTSGAGDNIREISTDFIDYTTREDEEDGDGYKTNNSNESRSWNPARYAGWFLDLPSPADSAYGSAERVIGTPVVRGGKIIVSTFVPDGTPCKGGGHSWLYILEAWNANPLSASGDEAISIRRLPGKIGDRPVILKDPSRARTDRIVLGDQAGRIELVEIAGEKWGSLARWARCAGSGA